MLVVDRVVLVPCPRDAVGRGGVTQSLGSFASPVVAGVPEPILRFPGVGPVGRWIKMNPTAFANLDFPSSRARRSEHRFVAVLFELDQLRWKFLGSCESWQHENDREHRSGAFFNAKSQRREAGKGTTITDGRREVPCPSQSFRACHPIACSRRCCASLHLCDFVLKSCFHQSSLERNSNDSRSTSGAMWQCRLSSTFTQPVYPISRSTAITGGKSISPSPNRRCS